MIDTYATARSMLADLAAKKVSARELLDAHVARNAQIAPAINAVVETDLARAQKDAAAVDGARARGTALGALAGLPMTVKDGFDVENMPATSGAPGFAGRAKDCADATLVDTARRAGAVIWGKTNVPYMLSDIQSYNAIYGTTNNPYDTTRTPGGSSGGAAAALATGVTPLEIGSDIGGSLRHPANFCGVTALKPTWGVLDGRGHVPPSPEAYFECDVGVYGPMARTVDDLKMFWSLLRGTPERTRRDIKGARVAIWDEEAAWPLARDVRAAVERAGDALEDAGAHVGHAKPDIDGTALMAAYNALLTPILALGMPEEAHRAFESMREADRKLVEADGPGARGAAFRLRASAPYREIVGAMVARQTMKDALRGFLHTYDAILMPVSFVSPFAHQHEGAFGDRVLDMDGETVSYANLLNWIAPASALHAPSIAVPAGRTSEDLPVGVQLVGAWNGEDRLFDFGFALEERLGGFQRPPL